MRTRFAPSPTGYLHVGNARVALLNWLMAEKFGGEFLVRIEDTDPERSKPEFEEAILEDLKWFLGFRGKVWRQSEHLETYREFAQRLLEEGKAYECFCSREELEELRQRNLQRGLPPRYDRRCLGLSEAEKQRLRAQGRVPSLRFRAEGTVTFEDEVFGPQRFRGEELGDFIIMRPEGVPTYNFACVIDDHLLGVTHVIRGEDHLPNTPRQILLYRAFGWDVPKFGHLPLLLGPDGKVLSKRHGPTSLKELREMGILPQALANYLLSLGGTTGDRILGWEEMKEAFSLSGISRSHPVFDMGRLLWFNREHLKGLGGEKLLELVGSPAGVNPHALELLRDEVSTLSELRERVSSLLREPEWQNRDLLGDGEVIRIALRELDRGKEGLLERVLRVSGKKPKEVFLPLRVALTGQRQGPELRKLLQFFDEGTIRDRLKKALRALER